MRADGTNAADVHVLADDGVVLGELPTLSQRPLVATCAICPKVTSTSSMLPVRGEQAARARFDITSEKREHLGATGHRQQHLRPRRSWPC